MKVDLSWGGRLLPIMSKVAGSLAYSKGPSGLALHHPQRMYLLLKECRRTANQLSG